MKSIALSAVALSAIVAPTLASSDLKVANYRTIPRQPSNKISGARRSLKARAGTDQVDLSNQNVLYVISLEIGSPSQNITVQIDTGSSDLWVPVKGSHLCDISDGQCDTNGAYDPTKSSPKDLNLPFQIEYGDKTQIIGEYVEDTVMVGSATVTGVQFAMCTDGSSKTGIQGILGIGYENDETTVVGAGSQDPSAKKYPNLLADMVSQGVINSLAYSLWLNDPNSLDGNVLFGGIDTEKFTGTLISMPVVPDATFNAFVQLSLPLTGISASADGQSFTYTTSNYAAPALMDSGTTLMFLPSDILTALAKSFGATIGKQGLPILPCSVGNDPTAKLTFTFGGSNGAKIDVLLTDLLAEASGTINGQQACTLLVGSDTQTEGMVILGDTFMRSSYIVYDLTNNMIAIAQSKFNTTSSNIKEINSSGIPGASTISTLPSGLQAQTAGFSGLPGAATSGFGSIPTTTGGGGALETTASAPVFSITNTAAGAGSTHKNAAVPAVQSPLFSIIGAVVGTVTLMSFFGGAMVVWF